MKPAKLNQMLISVFQVFLALCSSSFAAPYVITTFADMTVSRMDDFKWAVETCVSKGARPCPLIQTYSLEESKGKYNDYITWLTDISSDTMVEIAFHSYNSEGFWEKPRDVQTQWFENSRRLMLSKTGYLFRTYHWHADGGDEVTVDLFNNQETYFQVWLNPMFKGPDSLQNALQAQIRESAWFYSGSNKIKILEWPSIGCVCDTSSFDSLYTAFSNEPFLWLAGHVWSWDKMDTVRDTGTGELKCPPKNGMSNKERFVWILDYLNKKGVTWVTPSQYYRIMNNIHDVTPPSIPANVSADKVAKGRIEISWNSSTDSESGVDAYKIYRNDTCIDFSKETTYIDSLSNSAGASANDNSQYKVCAVNRVNLCSEKSQSASLVSIMPHIIRDNASSATKITALSLYTMTGKFAGKIADTGSCAFSRTISSGKGRNIVPGIYMIYVTGQEGGKTAFKKVSVVR